MKAHSMPISPTTPGEPMIDARQAAYALRLPYYWFCDRKMRAKMRIPHYLLGGLVRYRLSELEAWSLRFGHQQDGHDTGEAADSEVNGEV